MGRGNQHCACLTSAVDAPVAAWHEPSVAACADALEADRSNGLMWAHELILIGLVGIIDPPRPEARDAIRRCREAGIQVKMITGDHGITAGAIARELGLQGAVLKGPSSTAWASTSRRSASKTPLSSPVSRQSTR